MRGGRYEVTDPHFLEELGDEDLTMVDSESCVLTGTIVARYMEDPRGPRYKLVGRATDGRPLAIIVRIKETGVPLLITVFIMEEKR